MFDYVNSFFSDLGNWLTHPMRADYPMWKLMLIFTLFVIVALMIIDNLYVLKEVAADITDGVVDAIP
jgi:hypothetical protein